MLPTCFALHPVVSDFAVESILCEQISARSCYRLYVASVGMFVQFLYLRAGSVAEWLACWTQAQNGPGSNRSRDAVS